MAEKIVRIGGASGFWGDTAEGARQIVHVGNVHYMIMDYLAEITMSLLARAKAKNPDHGYPPDFVGQIIQGLGKDIAARGIKVVTNAGGVNPLACRDAVVKALREQGLSLKVAAVVGDDVAPLMNELKAEGLREMWTGAPPPAETYSANAYIGGFPIAAALAAGADIVVTGRAADSALVLGPLIHEFGWKPSDFDRLAAGTLAGHVIECGAQATGGMFTDWRDVADGWADIGFPIAECAGDGSFIVTKPDGTGGLVSTMTVAEQVTYETGDPANYVMPDVICDLTKVQVEQVGKDRVKVTGARGKAPTSTYKVAATYPDGFRSIGTLMVNGIEAPEKAKAVAASILKRCRMLAEREGLGDFADTSIEVLGAESTYGPNARALPTRETILKIGVRHKDKRAAEIFSKEVVPASIGTGQALAGVFGGRPVVQPVLRLYSFLLEKSRVSLAVDMDGKKISVPVPTDGQAVASSAGTAESYAPIPSGETVTVPLIAIAYGRSGDKGDTSNIAVLARRPEFLPVIARDITAEVIAKYLAYMVKGKVERFPWPGLFGFNFLLQASLGGGGVASLRYDPQGKTHAQLIMDFPVKVPKAWVASGLVKT